MSRKYDFKFIIIIYLFNTPKGSRNLRQSLSVGKITLKTFCVVFFMRFGEER